MTVFAGRIVRMFVCRGSVDSFDGFAVDGVWATLARACFVIFTREGRREHPRLVCSSVALLVAVATRLNTAGFCIATQRYVSEWASTAVAGKLLVSSGCSPRAGPAARWRA